MSLAKKLLIGLVQLALILWPAVIIAALVVTWARGVPVRDEWSEANIYRFWLQGHSLTSIIFQQTTVHIVPVEILAVVGTYHWLGGDMRWLCALTFVTMLAVWWIFSRLARHSLSGVAGWKLSAVSLLVSFILFSPAHSNVWLWGVCWPLTLPLLFLGLGMMLVRSQVPLVARLAGLSIFSTVAFLSYSSGLLVGPAFWVLLLLSHDDSVPHRRRALVGWTMILACLVAVLALRFNFSAVGEAAGLDETNKFSLSALLWAWCMTLGSPLGLGTSLSPRILAGGLGAAMLAGALALAVWLWRLPRQDQRRGTVAAWLAIFAFAAGNAFLMALSRGLRNDRLAFEARYILTVSPGTLAFLVMMIWLAKNQVFPRTAGRSVAAAILGIALVLLGGNWGWGLEQMQAWRASVLQGEAALLFSKSIPAMEVQRSNCPDAFEHPVAELAGFLQDRGVLAAGPVFPDGRLDRMVCMQNPLPASHARITLARRAKDGRITLQGFADLGKDNRPADFVLAARQEPDEASPTVISGTAPAIPDHYFSGRFSRRPVTSQATAWEIELPAEILPQREFKLSLWAVDVLKRRIRLISAPVAVDNTKPPTAEQWLLPVAP